MLGVVAMYLTMSIYFLVWPSPSESRAQKFFLLTEQKKKKKVKRFLCFYFSFVDSICQNTMESLRVIIQWLTFTPPTFNKKA